MLMPRRSSTARSAARPPRGKARAGRRLSFDTYGLQALEAAWITARQIEASRVAMTRYVKRGGKIWIRIFPDKPITKKLHRDPDG